MKFKITFKKVWAPLRGLGDGDGEGKMRDEMREMREGEKNIEIKREMKKK